MRSRLLPCLPRASAPAALLLLAACSAPLEPAPEEEPARDPGPRARNVIVVMTDDQGWGDLSLHGTYPL